MTAVFKAASDAATGVVRSPLRHLDPAEISRAARAETRNREVHLPPISVFRWWARRTEAVNGAIIDAVAAERDVDSPMLVVDPFAGGGVIPLAAAVRRHRVYAQDVNPWATRGLATMLGLPDSDQIREAAAALDQRVTTLIRSAYGTTMEDGERGTISHTFRVATASCTSCDNLMRLFPHALISLRRRKERGEPEAFVACKNGHVGLGRHDRSTKCGVCRTIVDPAAAYTPRRVATCAKCGDRQRLQDLAATGTWGWQVVLVERTRPRVRELAVPTDAEISAADNPGWQPTRDLGVIPVGQETAVLRRHGFAQWTDLYPRRQRYVVESLLDAASEVTEDERMSGLLALAIVGSTEMAGLCSRWDRWYLKSFEAMAGHRFNFTTLPVEPNAWGTPTSGRGTVLRRLDQLVRAADWLHEHAPERRVVGPVGPSQRMQNGVTTHVVEGSSETLALGDASADLVLTDPPYHDDVQYAELSMPLRAWAGLDRSVLNGEAVVNPTTGQQTADGEYQSLLQRIFTEAARTLKPGGHLIFSYANRAPGAWSALFDALHAARLRAVGCEIVHSENERDGAKRNVKACTLDLILDLVSIDTSERVVQSGPGTTIEGEEADFLRVVAAEFLQVGSSSYTAGEREGLRALRQASFTR